MFDFEYASGRTDWQYIQSIPYWKDAAVTSIWLAIVSLSVLYIAIVCVLVEVLCTAGNSRHRLALLLCLLVASPSTTALAFLVKKPLIPQAEMPSPNGYNDFLKAAQLLPPRVTVRSANFDPDKDPLGVVRKAIAEVRPSIDLVRVGLAKGFRQPLDYSCCTRLISPLTMRLPRKIGDDFAHGW